MKPLTAVSMMNVTLNPMMMVVVRDIWTGETSEVMVHASSRAEAEAKASDERFIATKLTPQIRLKHGEPK